MVLTNNSSQFGIFIASILSQAIKIDLESVNYIFTYYEGIVEPNLQIFHQESGFSQWKSYIVWAIKQSDIKVVHLINIKSLIA